MAFLCCFKDSKESKEEKASAGPRPSIKSTAAASKNNSNIPPEKPTSALVQNGGTSNRGSGSKRTLWDQAFASLNDDDKVRARSILEVGASTYGNVGTKYFTEMKKELEDKQAECEKHRWKVDVNGKPIIFRDVVGKILNWVIAFEAIGDIIEQIDPMHAGPPWVFIKLGLEVIVAGQKQEATLLAGMERIGFLTNTCKVYEELYIGSTQQDEFGASLAKENLENDQLELYKSMLHFLVSATAHYDTGIWARVKKTSRAFFTPDKYKEFIDDSNAKWANVEIDAGNCERTLGRKRSEDERVRYLQLSKIVQDMKAPIVRIDKNVAALKESFDETENNTMLNWVCKVLHEEVHRTFEERRETGTCRWILESEKYREWRNSSASEILWLHGIPGAGKSMLTSNVITSLQETLHEAEGCTEGLAFFFCDEQASESYQAPVTLLRSFVRQLCSFKVNGKTQTNEKLLAMYKSSQADGHAAGQWDWNECRTLLQSFINQYPQTTLIVNALDKYGTEDNRRELLDLFKNLRSASDRPLKVFISSLDDDDIKFQLHQESSIKVSPKDNREDIKTFLTRAVAKRTQSRDWVHVTDDARGKIIPTILDTSDGMFLWAQIQVDQILAYTDDDSIIAQLDSLPSNGTILDKLGETLNRILAKIDKQTGLNLMLAHGALQLLQTMHFDDPNVDPAADLLGGILLEVDAEKEKFNYTLEDVLRVTHSILTETTAFGNFSDGRPFIKFAHSAILEYVRAHRWSAETAQELAAKNCLRRLNGWAASRNQAKPNNKAFAAYASGYWHTHVRAYGNILHKTSDKPTAPADEEFERLLSEFLGTKDASSAAYREWVDGASEHGYKMGEQQSVLRPSSSSIFAVCVGGFDWVMQDWLNNGLAEKKELLNATNDLGQTPLMLAAKHGWFSICKLLIAANTDLTVLCRDNHWLAIDYAMEGGIDVVKLLIDAGSDLTTHGGGRYGSTLAVAVRSGSLAPIDALLAAENAPDVNVASGSALLSAIKTVNLKAIHKLVEQDHAEINFPDVLPNAVDSGPDVLQILLEHGLDVGVQVPAGYIAGGGSIFYRMLSADYINEAVFAQLLAAWKEQGHADSQDLDSELWLSAQRFEADDRFCRSLLTAGARVNFKYILASTASKRETILPLLHFNTGKRGDAKLYVENRDAIVQGLMDTAGQIGLQNKGFSVDPDDMTDEECGEIAKYLDKLAGLIGIGD